MIFIICLALGIIGTVGILWFSSGSLHYLENPVPKGQEWFRLHPEHIEARFAGHIRERIRELLKDILVVLIGWYRAISKKITIKQVVKKKVRAFLYDHKPDGERHPSAFWNQVKKDSNDTDKMN